MTNGTFLKSASLLLLATMMTGCQVGGSVVGEREGYFTWVDEQGRVRYSPIVGSTGQGAGKGTDEPSALDAEAEYTLENYPDAEQLAKDGYIRPGQRQPYFTWRDAQGNIRVSYYQPDTRLSLIHI